MTHDDRPHPTSRRRRAVDDEPRRSTGLVRRTDVFALLGSAVAALSLTAWVVTQLHLFEGPLPFIVVSFLLVPRRSTRSCRASTNRISPCATASSPSSCTGSRSCCWSALILVVVFTFVRGVEALVHPNFFTQDMSATGPLDPLTSGGVIHAIAGTLIMITMALVISIPLGIATAVYMSEFPGKFSQLVRTVVEAMTALPSIVAGLFIYATVILILGVDRSGFAASLAITVMMLPIIIRSADVVLRLVPGNLKEASRALGASSWRTVWNVTLPTARSGLTTAIILGTARGIGETSPVLLTAGLTTYLNLNPFSGPMVSLPLATFSFVKSPEPAMIARGFGAAAVLMVLVLILFFIARAHRRPRARACSRRASVAARTLQSRDDDYRFRARELGIAAGSPKAPRTRRGVPEDDMRITITRGRPLMGGLAVLVALALGLGRRTARPRRPPRRRSAPSTTRSRAWGRPGRPTPSSSGSATSGTTTAGRSSTATRAHRPVASCSRSPTAATTSRSRRSRTS